MAAVQDPDDPTGSLISGARVAGSEVFSRAGDKLGTIEDVMIDKQSGRIAYAILHFGGFMGLGGRRHPLPWATLSYNPALGGYVIALRGAPWDRWHPLTRDRPDRDRLGGGALPGRGIGKLTEAGAWTGSRCRSDAPTPYP